MRITLAVSCALLIVLAREGQASPVMLTFDSVAVAAGECVDGSGYLASFGVTFMPVTSGTSANICNVAGSGVIPSSGSNVFFGLPEVTNTDLSYELAFSVPQSEVSFTRAAVPSFTALPPWQAFAFDMSDNLLSATPFQPVMFPGPGEAVFTLTGPNIARVRIDAFNSAHVTYNHPPFDDLILDVPEPSTLSLLGAALGLAPWLRRRRSARTL